MYGSLNYRVRRVGEEGDKSKAANFVVSRFLPPASNSPPSGVAIAPPGLQWSWLISCCMGSTSFFCLHFWVERWGYSFPSGLNLYNFLRNFIDFKLIQLRSWTVIEIYNHEMFHEVGSIFSSAVAKNRFLSFYSTAAAFQWPLPIYRYALLYHSYHHLAHHHCKVLVLYLSRLHSWMRWTTAVHDSIELVTVYKVAPGEGIESPMPWPGNPNRRQREALWTRYQREWNGNFVRWWGDKIHQRRM